jgi:preprotein translocase subunit SecG
VKFFAYHESAGLVFAVIVAVTLVALVVYQRGVSAGGRGRANGLG